MKNKTTIKSFDKLEFDSRVTEVYSEEDDGYVVELSEGYHFEECVSIRGRTAKEIFSDLARVEIR